MSPIGRKYILLFGSPQQREVDFFNRNMNLSDESACGLPVVGGISAKP
jgi:hypothetical protein